MAHILRNIAVIQHIVGEHLFQLFHEHLGAVGLDKDTVKLRIFFQVSTELQQQWGRITKEVCKFKFFQYFQHLCNDLVFDFLGHTPNIRVMGIESRSVYIRPIDNISHRDFRKVFFFQQHRIGFPNHAPGTDRTAVFCSPASLFSHKCLQYLIISIQVYDFIYSN